MNHAIVLNNAATSWQLRMETMSVKNRNKNSSKNNAIINRALAEGSLRGAYADDCDYNSNN